MSTILYIGLAMAALAFLFWSIELWPFLMYAKGVKRETSEKVITNFGLTVKYNATIVYGSPKLMPFIIDMCVTTALTSIFSFGGMVGGIIGLLISNLFSILIIFVSKMSIPEDSE